jgi:glycosyltransferase involved in cell wall biosynthesis
MHVNPLLEDYMAQPAISIDPAIDAVLCMGPETRAVWHEPLGRQDLRAFQIETPPMGWAKKTQVTDPQWAFVARNIRSTLEQLQREPFQRLHVFANSPYSLGVLLSAELDDRFGRSHQVIIYQRDARTRAWTPWGILGQPMPAAGSAPLLSAPPPRDPGAAHVVVALNVLFDVQRAEMEQALREQGIAKYEWLDVAGPRYVEGRAEAERLAADVDELLRSELPRRYPGADLHLCYPGPLAALILGTAKLHVASRRTTVYERQEAGEGAFRYAAVLQMPQRRLFAGDQIIILAVVDEWFTRKGGISTFNRELCKAIARCGYRILCYIKEGFSAEEAADAEAQGVKLIYNPPEEAPDLLIGHDHITGEAALRLKQERYQRSVFAYLVHTAPDEIEWYKEGEDADRKAAEKKATQVRIAEQADRVFGIGPLLTNHIHDALRAACKRFDHVEELRPWLIDAQRSVGLPREPRLLLVGRPEHVQLKGIDLAVRALAALETPRPPLILRGAAPGTTARLKETLTDVLDKRGLRGKLRIQTFDANEGRNAEAFRGATLVLMPSRSEGFGLVGLEAISFGVPVLVSSESGLARVLREVDTEASRGAVITHQDDEEEDIRRWAQAIRDKLLRTKAAHDEAGQLYEDLRDKLDAARIVPAFIRRCMKAA